MRANPFAQPSHQTVSAARRRLTTLPGRVVRMRDDDVAESICPAPVLVYAPKGKAATLVDALRKHGPMRSSGLARVTGIHPRSFNRAFERAVEHGLVRVQKDEQGLQVWSAT